MKLPLWRALAGFAVLGILVGVLFSLGPVYLDNYRLDRAMESLVLQNVADEAMREQTVVRARELDLPVKPAEVKVSHSEGTLRLEANYVVEMNLAFYQVDLHFHPHAER